MNWAATGSPAKERGRREMRNRAFRLSGKDRRSCREMFMIGTISHFGKGKSRETVKRLGVSGKRGLNR